MSVASIKSDSKIASDCNENEKSSVSEKRESNVEEELTRQHIIGYDQKAEKLMEKIMVLLKDIRLCFIWEASK